MAVAATRLRAGAWAGASTVGVDALAGDGARVAIITVVAGTKVADNATWALGSWGDTGAALGAPQPVIAIASAPSVSTQDERQSRKKPCTSNSPNDVRWRTTPVKGWHASVPAPDLSAAARNAPKFTMLSIL